jgi:cyclopropane-fatty-acyl-phospholipid synthase
MFASTMRAAKSCVVSSLEAGLKKGNILIHDAGEALCFGQTATDIDKPRLSATITIINKNFWARVYLSHDLGCKCSI